MLEPQIEDDGAAGAELAVADNNTTGRFTNQHYALVRHKLARDASAEAAFRQMHGQGLRLFLLDLPAAELLRLADLPEAADSLLFNISALDDALRLSECRPNLLHTAPSRAMLADALAQYLAWMRWREWFLVVGRHPRDQAYAEALRRAAERYGMKIEVEKRWTFEPGARRTDSGHTRLQQMVKGFTQVDDHDVLVVADELDEFGEYLLYRTDRPRPVAGTHGLSARAWSAVHEQWGATQFQRRFGRAAGRAMTSTDYAAWLAVRSIGEAATRTGVADARRLTEYARSEEFELAAFKGVAVTYRDWNGQLRQPLLLAGPRLMVSVSPQSGFLHQYSVLDTLGYDRPESQCR